MAAATASTSREAASVACSLDSCCRQALAGTKVYWAADRCDEMLPLVGLHEEATGKDAGCDDGRYGVGGIACGSGADNCGGGGSDGRGGTGIACGSGGDALCGGGAAAVEFVPESDCAEAVGTAELDAELVKDKLAGCSTTPAVEGASENQVRPADAASVPQLSASKDGEDGMQGTGIAPAGADAAGSGAGGVVGGGVVVVGADWGRETSCNGRRSCGNGGSCDRGCDGDKDGKQCLGITTAGGGSVGMGAGGGGVWAVGACKLLAAAVGCTAIACIVWEICNTDGCGC